MPAPSVSGTEVPAMQAMLQVRIHGRGGQGVVTAAEVLSMAAFAEGRHAQAFPSFGSERTGAPVVAFCRIAHTPIRTREPVMNPDVLVVLDATLLHQVDLFSGLRPDGAVLINTSRSLDELGILELAREHSEGRFVTVPATDIAVERLGRPVPNVVMLGGLAAITGNISIDALASAIRERFSSEMAERNVAAASDAYHLVESSSRQEVLRVAPD
ncbi:MAG TPA: 2-oxoacid:acceptor oxidoreductase family protein [Acidimicrobiales bacterium]|nr:2-oxoacid:acceptor oxidoreductase family protein [Acidimicrobiales bacterium]